jgi:hypothetical protein
MEEERCPPFARVTGEDSFIPLGAASYAVLPSEDGIKAAARGLVERTRDS